MEALRVACRLVDCDLSQWGQGVLEFARLASGRFAAYPAYAYAAAAARSNTQGRQSVNRNGDKLCQRANEGAGRVCHRICDRGEVDAADPGGDAAIGDVHLHRLRDPARIIPLRGRDSISPCTSAACRPSFNGSSSSYPGPLWTWLFEQFRYQAQVLPQLFGEKPE